MKITEMMIEQIRKAIPALDDEHTAVPIPEMGGYFVTYADNDIPENTKRIVELGIDGRKYLVFATFEAKG